MSNAKHPIKNRTDPTRLKQRSGTHTQSESEAKSRERRRAVGQARSGVTRSAGATAIAMVRSQLGKQGQAAAKPRPSLDSNDLLLEAVRLMNGALAEQAAAGKALREALEAEVGLGKRTRVSAAEAAHAVAARFVVACKRGGDFARHVVKDVWVRQQVDGPGDIEITTTEHDTAVIEAELERVRAEAEDLRAELQLTRSVQTTH